MATPKIFESMVKAMGMIEAIGKDKTNTFHKFKYRGIDDVYNCLHPILKECGIFTLPKVLNVQREERASQQNKTNIFTIATIQYTFCAVDGSSVECVVVGEALDNGDKSMNKAMAIAHKYAMFQTFCIPTEDMPDPDSQSHILTQRPPQSPKLKPLPGELDSLLQSASSVDELGDIYKANKAKAAERGYGKEWDVATTARKNQLTQGEF